MNDSPQSEPRRPAHGSNHPGSEIRDPESEIRNRGAAVAALLVLAATVACTQVWDHDAFWHLAAGDWMLRNGQVLRSDPFAVSDRPPGQTPWLNVHWLFQAIVSLVHQAGGFEALTALKMVMLAALVSVLAAIAGRRVRPAWLLLCGVWMIVGVESRFRVRPEIFSLVFLLATLGVLESVRAGRSPRRLWWLLPIFVVWVNVHGLYFLGPMAAIAALVGWILDRRLGRHPLPPHASNTNPPLPRGAITSRAKAAECESQARQNNDSPRRKAGVGAERPGTTDTNPPLPRGAIPSRAEENSPRRKAGVGAEPVGWDERSESRLLPSSKGGTRKQRSFHPTSPFHPMATWIVPMVAAIAACFAVSPFPVFAALHPLTLASRVVGLGGLYKFGVQELRPTYLCNPLTNVPLLIAAGLAVATIAAMILRRRFVPCAHVLWLVLFLAIGLLAVRNTVFFVVPAAMLLALHGPRAKKQEARNSKSEIRNKHEAPGGKETPSPKAFGVCRLPLRICFGFRISDFGFAAALLVVAGLAAAYATETVFRWQRRPEGRVGFGLVEGIQPVEMARWLNELPEAGAVLPLEFGHGGTLIYFCPSRQVWMDGRLELHSVERFRALQEIRDRLDLGRRAGDPDRAPLPPEVRFLVVGLSDSRWIESLRRWPTRFQAIYADRVGVCFARIPQPGEHVTWPADPPVTRTNRQTIDRRLTPELAPLLDVPTRRHWYRQNVPPAHWQTGAVLNLLAEDPIAWRYLAVAEWLKLADPVQRLRILAQSHQRLGELRPLSPDAGFPADPNLSRAFALYDRLEAMVLEPQDARAIVLARLRGQMNAGQIDAADATCRRLEAMPASPGEPAGETAEVRRSVRLMIESARQRREEMDFAGLLPAERAMLLMRKDIGMIEAAIAELAGEPEPSAAALVQLGDLCLQTGRIGRARQAYARLDGQRWDVRMRLGLCDWAEGDLAGAITRLGEAVQGAAEDSLAPRALLAGLHEQMGDYAAALKLAGPYASDSGNPRLPAGAIGTPPEQGLSGPERTLRRIADRLMRAHGTVRR